MAHKGTTKFIVTFNPQPTGCGDPQCCGPNPSAFQVRYDSRTALAEALLLWRSEGEHYSSVDIQPLSWNTLPPHLL